MIPTRLESVKTGNEFKVSSSKFKVAIGYFELETLNSFPA
jgi:hypothetical protein